MKKCTQNEVGEKRLEFLHEFGLQSEPNPNGSPISNEAKFINTSVHQFSDISSEVYRVYEFESGKAVRIDGPLKLNVSPSGGHRVFDASGTSHYIPKGWVHLRWETKEGRPHFVK